MITQIIPINTIDGQLDALKREEYSAREALQELCASRL